MRLAKRPNEPYNNSNQQSYKLVTFGKSLTVLDIHQEAQKQRKKQSCLLYPQSQHIDPKCRNIKDKLKIAQVQLIHCQQYRVF